MKKIFIHSTALFCFLLMCAPHPAIKPTLNCQPASFSGTPKVVGITGILFIEPLLPPTVKVTELEQQGVQQLINNLSNDRRFKIADRTKLSHLMKEYALNLSGVIVNPPQENAVDIQSTDLLLVASISGFRLRVGPPEDDTELRDAPFLTKGEVRFILNLTLIDSKSGTSLWSASREGRKTQFENSEANLDSRRLAFSAMAETIIEALTELRCVEIFN